MKNIINNILHFVFLVLICGIIIYPSIYDYQCKNRTYSELETEVVNVFSSNISIITVTRHEDVTSYGVGASGVVFDKIDGRYYALTAYHIVADQDTM